MEQRKGQGQEELLLLHRKIALTTEGFATRGHQILSLDRTMMSRKMQ